MELPDEIWDYIKEFVFDWKKSHALKFDDCIGEFFFYADESMGEIYERWTYPPPVWQNTNDIIRAEYLHRIDWAPPANLELTSITFNITENTANSGGWWCGYGWKQYPNLRKTPFL